MSALNRTATMLCAAALLGCTPDSGPDVLAPSDVLTPRLAASGAAVDVYNFSAPFGVRVNDVNTPAPEHEASFTQDGHTMYFRCDDPSPGGTGFDICVSRLLGTFEDGRWTDPERLPGPINTKFGDQEPKISRNGKRLFFQSDRPGGFGGADVYYSDLVDGEWQTPVNLGPPINTRFNDHCLYFEDMRAYDDFDMETDVYLASNRSGTMGGNDMWISRRKDGVYSEPVNLGRNINSRFNDHMAMVGPDGRLWVTTNDSTREGATLDLTLAPEKRLNEDMYRSTRQADGSWGPIVNMGPNFNTAKDDRCADFVMGTGQGAMERSDKANAKGNVIYAVYASTDRFSPAPGMGNRDLWYFRLDDLLKAEDE
jgi:hypothetical protein